MSETPPRICTDPQHLFNIRRLAQLARIADTQADRERYARQIEALATDLLGQREPLPHGLNPNCTDPDSDICSLHSDMPITWSPPIESDF